MSINIGDNLSYLGAKPLDGRLKYDTVSEMAGMADNVLYEGCLAYCVGTGKTYQWKSSNTVDPTTGKWREFTSGGGTAEDPIEYVSQLPTSGIQNKTYGIKVTSGITKTIQIIKPIAGQLTKEEATAYFSQFFTVTEESNTRLSLSVYPDLVLSRDGWTQDYKAADGDIVTLTYRVDTQELLWTNLSSQETSTAAWSVSPIRCTSAYFPTYKYYAGVESSQELNELGAGGGGGNANIFTGTRADWESLTDEQKAVYDQVNLTDDLAGGEMAVVDEVANGNLNPVTSNAVFDSIKSGIKDLFRSNNYSGQTNCNNWVVPGMYNAGPSNTNTPEAGGYGLVVVFGNNPDTASGSNQWIWQVFFGAGTSTSMYFRKCINPNSLTPTQWTNWVTIA